jgi:hypothetical protein
MAAPDLLGAQFARTAPNLGHRGASRSLPWVIATKPTRTYKAKSVMTIRTPSFTALRGNIARATRGHKTG